jgi:hypothetical protein
MDFGLVSRHKTIRDPFHSLVFVPDADSTFTASYEVSRLAMPFTV